MISSQQTLWKPDSLLHPSLSTPLFPQCNRHYIPSYFYLAPLSATAKFLIELKSHKCHFNPLLSLPQGVSLQQNCVHKSKKQFVFYKPTVKARTKAKKQQSEAGLVQVDCCEDRLSTSIQYSINYLLHYIFLNYS